jgi:hypothetical protein
MKTETELNYDILKLIMTINEMFPQILKYIGEIPINIADSLASELRTKFITVHYNTLNALLKKYPMYYDSLPK